MKTSIMVLLSILFLAGVVVEARSQPQVKFDATDDEKPRPEQMKYKYPSKGKSSPRILQGNNISKQPQVKFDATDDEKPRPAQMKYKYPSKGNNITKRPQVKFDATDDEKPRPLYVPKNPGKFK